MNPIVREYYNQQNNLHTLELPRKSWDKRKHFMVYRNDKVMVVSNTCHEEYEVYNGESGYLTDTNENYCTIDLGDRQLQCPKQLRIIRNAQTIFIYPRQNIELAYVITTHKAQGGEYDTVLYLLDNSKWSDKRNIYTAITRARKKCIILATNPEKL